ncbi:MAG: hypothetical protein KKD39_04225 [Candidatus Altiarchaeota archaeon]|nr:hypothetical protein [Candidatus Altiarchaeota archaeon]
MKQLNGNTPDIHGIVKRHGRSRERLEADERINLHNRKLILGYCDYQRRQQLSIHSTDKVLITLARAISKR